MVDENTPDNPEVTVALDGIETSLEDGLDVDSSEVAEKLARLKKAFGLDERGIAESSEQRQHVGADVDWSEYDLDPGIAHLYPKSRLESTPEGPRWAVDITEFIALKERYDTLGKKITQLINGPEGWRLQSAIVPVNSNTGVVTLQRVFPILLPTPMMLKKQEDVAPTPLTEEETAAMEKQALDWVNGVGIAPEPPSTPAEAITPISLEARLEAGDPDRPND